MKYPLYSTEEYDDVKFVNEGILSPKSMPHWFLRMTETGKSTYTKHNMNLGSLSQFWLQYATFY